MDLTGEKVIHKSFGEGTIIAQYRATDGGERITVGFEKVEKTFVFPMIFETILKMCDPVLDQKIQKLLAPPPPPPPPPPYRYRTVYAKSRADFLEKVFGSGNYREYEIVPGKCTWSYNDIIVWMVVFDSPTFGYTNTVLPDGQIEEEYSGNEQKRIDRTHSDYRFPYRLAVSIEDNFRKFRILGLYYYDNANFVPRKAYFAPISPEKAYKKIPQAFIPDPRNV